MEDRNIYSMDECLLQCLEGRADRETYDRVWQWASSSIENRQHYRAMLDVLIASNLLTPVNREIQERVWRRLSSKIQATGKSPKPVRRTLFKWVAAAAVLLLAYVAGIQTAGRFKSGRQYTVETSGGGKSMLTLSDGSKVWLNKATTIRYGNDYGQKNREITLDGEAYFEVARDADKPFIVKTCRLDVQALGTQFNVKACAGDRFIDATLIEGKIKVLADEQGTVLQQAGQQLRYDKTNAKTTLLTVSGNHCTAWKDGVMIFDGEPVKNVFAVMEENFNIPIRLKNKKLAARKITGRFSLNEQPEKILKILQQSLSFKYKVTNDTIFIK
ncbi:MAG: FecR domain-containing protein [Bacteroidales bacterium]|jgi:ferric-dicitrate binding protein FerR (iron transport regulator)|nr:FecR domain-containing protein [Bacteroidales bacterium]